jgi:hypothetical protein
MGNIMTHYIAILRATEGEWHALFPDIPDCEVRGASLDQVKFAAANELTQRIQTTGSKAPQPRDLSEIGRDHDWLSRNKVDLATAVVTMIPLGG